jgi:hypothetical protein
MNDEAQKAAAAREQMVFDSESENYPYTAVDMKEAAEDAFLAGVEWASKSNYAWVWFDHEKNHIVVNGQRFDVPK